MPLRLMQRLGGRHLLPVVAACAVTAPGAPAGADYTDHIHCDQMACLNVVAEYQSVGGIGLGALFTDGRASAWGHFEVRGVLNDKDNSAFYANYPDVPTNNGNVQWNNPGGGNPAWDPGHDLHMTFKAGSEICATFWEGTDHPYLRRGVSCVQIAAAPTSPSPPLPPLVPSKPAAPVPPVPPPDSPATRGRARVKLRLSARRKLRNGQVFVLKGRVSKPVPDDGAIVLLQSRKDGKWVLFGRMARTDSRGRFARGYRFRYTTGLQRYRLRVYVPRQAGYPFKAGKSRSVVVRVSG